MIIDREVLTDILLILIVTFDLGNQYAPGVDPPVLQQAQAGVILIYVTASLNSAAICYLPKYP